MKKIFQLCAVLAVMFAVTGCYNDFDAPKPAKVYTDEDFAGMKHISIADVKQMFLDEHKSLGGTGSNSSWGDTKYVQIGQSSDGLDYYIKGKVQSSDEEGNVYKSLYLVDDSGAIEVKLTTGLYFTYPMGRFDKATGTIPSNWVYVKVSGLYIGHPEAYYFGVAKVEHDQVLDYAERKGMSLRDAERWLGPILNYTPAAAVAAE